MRCPYCNSTDLKVAEGKTSCRTCFRKIPDTAAATDCAPAGLAAEGTNLKLAAVSMACPSCGASNVSPMAGTMTWCNECWQPFVATPGTGSAPVVQAMGIPNCPGCHSTNLGRIRGRPYCQDCKTIIPCLIRCPMCMHEVSSYTELCPACGHPLKTWLKNIKELKARNLAALVWLVIVILWAIWHFTNG
jgi:hypothetical protein